MSPTDAARPVRTGAAAMRTLAVAAACALLAAGCGDDQTAGRRTFVAAADRICAQANDAAAGFAARIGVAQRGRDPAAVYREVAALTRRRAVTARGFLDRLDALELPDGDRDELKAWIAGQRARQALVLTLATAFARSQDARISTLSQRIDALNSTSNAFARRYGMTACARSVA